MRPTIAINSIIAWVPKTGDERPIAERILWRGGDDVVVIRLDPLALPVWRKVSDIEDALADGTAVRMVEDPYTRLSNVDPKYVEKHQHRLARAWQIVETLVRDEPDIYLPDKRGILINQTIKRLKKVTKHEVYSMLRRYWLAGKVKNALLPHYSKCGGPGKSRIIQSVIIPPPTIETVETTILSPPPIEHVDFSIISPPAVEIVDTTIIPAYHAKRGRRPAVALIHPDEIGVNVDTDTYKIFDVAAKLYIDRKKHNFISHAYNQMRDNFFNVGFDQSTGVPVPVLRPKCEVPTLRQFSYWYHNHRDIEERIIAKCGVSGFSHNFRPILGNSTEMAFGPGSIFQIDATIADVYLVSSLNRSWIIGRPVIYMVMDVFSRMIVGLYIGLEGPSWVGAMMALANTTYNKVDFCAEYGIDIEWSSWPCQYQPEQILADRGELISIPSDRLASELDIHIANCPPYRPDWKGIIEQNFRILNNITIRWLPGAVRRREIGEKNHDLDAKMTLRDFTKVMIATVITMNNSHWIHDYPSGSDMIADDVRPIPIELWEWGIQNRTGHLRAYTEDRVKLALLPRDTAKITGKGIRFNGMYYSTEMAGTEKWFVKARYEGNWTIPICYDKRDIERIYLCPPNEDAIVATLLTTENRFKKGKCMHEEVEDYFAIEKIRESLHGNATQQFQAELSAYREYIEAEATEQTRAAIIASGITKSQRIREIRNARQFERMLNRLKETFKILQVKSTAIELKETSSPSNASTQGMPTEAMTAAEKKMLSLRNLEKLE